MIDMVRMNLHAVDDVASMIDIHWTKGAGKAKHVGFKKFLKLLHLIAAQKGIEDDKFVAAVVKKARIKTKKTVATSPVLGGRKKLAARGCS